MTGNGRASQRPQSRPPFLVIGLLVALGILGFNYWNLSTANGTLTSTNIDFQDQIRILQSKKLSEEQSKRDVERKYNLLEQRITAKDSDITKLQAETDQLKGDLEKSQTAKKECDNNMQTCEVNNNGIQQQLDTVNQQLDALKKKQEDPQICESVCKEQAKKVYTDIFQKVGSQYIQQLINVGIDVGDDLKTQVQQGAANKQIQPPKPEEQKQNQANQNDVQPPKAGDGQQSAQGKRSFMGDVKETLQNGVNSLNNISLHAIILNKTQEGINMGLKRSKQLAEMFNNGDGTNLHDSSKQKPDPSIEKKTQNEFKNGTLVGNNKPQNSDDLKKNKDDTKSAIQGEDDQPKDTIKSEKKKEDRNVAKTEKDDVGYDDDDDNELADDRVEESRDQKKTPVNTEEDGIDALKRKLNN